MANHWLTSAASEYAAQPKVVRPWKERMRPHVLMLFIPLLVLGDLFLINLCFGAVYHMRFVWKTLAPVSTAPAWGPYFSATMLMSLIWVLLLAVFGLYRSRPSSSKFDDFVRLVFALGMGALVTLAAGFFYRSFSYSRLVMVISFAFTVLAVGTLHMLVLLIRKRLLARGIGVLNAVIVGCNSLGEMMGTRIKNHPRLGYRLLGFIPAPGEEVQGNPWIYEVNTRELREPSGPPFGAVLGDADRLPAVIDRYAVDEVILAVADTPFSQIFDLIGQCSGRTHVRFRVVPDILELVTANLHINLIDGVPTLVIQDVPLRKWYNRFIKRTLDIVFSALGLVVASPFFLLTAIAVKLSSPGPVFYRQERLGRDGGVFYIYKFRSMRIDAETRSGPIWASSDDPRSTRVGSFLRRFSIDEIPQLWNVLKGDMSLVGPRPERPYFVDQFKSYIPKYMDRHLVRSGLTGWAQINGQRGKEGSIEERTRYDIYYIENWSVLFDLRILFKTVYEVIVPPLFGRNHL